MRTKVFRTAAGALTAVVLSLATAGCGGDSGDAGSESDSVKVGLLAAITGPAASQGALFSKAVESRVGAANEGGGINGRKIELVKADSKSDPVEAGRQAGIMLDKGVIAILGPSTGSEALAMADQMTRAKVPMISGVATAALTDPSKTYFPWVFRSYQSATAVVPIVLKAIAGTGGKTIGIVYTEDAYGQGTADRFEAEATKLGLKVATKSSLPITAVDAGPQMRKVVSADPDAIIVLALPPALNGAAAKGARDAGFKKALYGTDGTPNVGLMSAGGAATEGFLMPSLLNPSKPADLPELTKLLEADGGIQGVGSMLGVMTFAILAAGLESGPNSGSELRDAIEASSSITLFDGFTAGFSPTNHDGLAALEMPWLRVEGGAFVTGKMTTSGFQAGR